MSSPRAKLVAGLLVSVLFIYSAGAQPFGKDPSRYDRESGNFYVKNYSGNIYNAVAQNWAVIQDSYGNMLFANGDGVLLYDGKRWSLIETPSESVIRSMIKRKDGRVFIGALDDLGYIERKDNGQSVYVSLLDKLPSDLQKMGNIWSIQIINDEVYFESEIGLFQWNDERFEFSSWPDKSAFHKTFVWRNRLYASEPTSGLLLFSNGKFTAAPGGEAFRNIRIYAAIPTDDAGIVFGTKYDGLYRYDGKQVTVFQTAANAYLKQYEVYTGLNLPGGHIGIGTKSGGVVILDQSGAVKSMIRREDGLPTNSIRGMFVDQRQNLWLALEEGISHLEIANNLSVYDERMGLESAVNDICRFRGDIYVNTIDGTFKLEPSHLPDRKAYFRRLGLPPQATCWTFEQMGDRLLISSSLGVFELRNGTVSRITQLPAFAIHRFLADTTRIMIAEEHALSSRKLVKEHWVNVKGIDSLRLDNIKFNETLPGKLWINTFSQGAVLISYINDEGIVDYDEPDTRHFGAAQGLPDGFIKISSVGGYESFRVGTESQLFRFNYQQQRFEEDSLFSFTFGFDSLPVFPVTEENRNGAFLMKTKRAQTGTRKLFIVTPSDSRYTHQEVDMSRIFDRVGVITFWDEYDSAAWHIGAELMIRQRFSNDGLDTATFATFINKVIVGGDSILFDGTGTTTKESTFTYGLSSLRFEFTSNNFVAEETNLFQYKLDGYDDKWSEWSNENIKEYSSLWEGDYRFWVRSKDYAGRVSQAQSFDFIILAPWYRSSVAYIAYFLILSFAVWLLVRWRSSQLEKDKVALQAEISRHTIEIRQQNVQLEKQSEALSANAKQLKELDTLKSNFFINISHEFRTPLSLIVGPLEKFIANSSSVKTTELERMHRSAKRLQQLINQLLDLAKLESGTLKVVEQRADFLYFLRVVAASFESLSDTKAIRYEVDIPPGAYETIFDTAKLETVLYNLLSNAFKFTPENGRIDFKVLVPVDNKDEIVISVSDTGPGIPLHALDHIFDRFFQVDSSSSRAFEGSGIGLSLVREIIALLKGSVVVESQNGAGATFTVRLPMPGTYSPNSQNVLPQHAGIAGTLSKDDTKIDDPIADADTSDDLPTSVPLILLIEDNKDLREYLQENLEADFRVITAENGKTGLEKALDLIPDLILSDMMMPLMDGFTLCTAVRADERISHIPFILLTARATIESKLAGLELGADDYVTKPFNFQELQVRIKNLLDQRTKLRKSYSRELRIEPKSISVTSVDEQFLNRALEIAEANLS
ncbi:MAG TPA: ATP-binding protein, partial [Chryseolinea sp.]|nr:ATP-binding protein [Chryseolinea sp.]